MGLGRSYESFHHDFRFADYAVVAVIALLVAYLVVRRRQFTQLRTRDARREKP